MKEHIDRIAERMTEPALFELMAEECVEMAHACLKAARKLRGENPTPLHLPEIVRTVSAEWADVCLTAQALALEPDEDIMREKAQRWIGRLEAGKC